MTEVVSHGSLRTPRHTLAAGLRRRSAARTSPDPEVSVLFQPILDVARGVAAGYQVVPVVGPGTDADAAVPGVVRAALAAFSTLPTNTFMSIPVPQRVIGDGAVRDLLHAHGDLSGIVLDVTEFTNEVTAHTEDALELYRAAGAKIAVGGRDGSQPELGSIVRLRPAIIRLGGEWVRGLDTSPARRSAIEVTGRLAAQLDAWILVDAVTTPAELRALSELDVPLARGPFIGEPQPVWPAITPTARRVLPPAAAEQDGVLRDLLQHTYTTTDQAAARSVLPDATGFDVVVVVDDRSRPVSLLQPGTFGRWEPSDVLRVNVDTPLRDAVDRAMARSRPTRFTPVVCTDAAGRFVGILRMERLMSHLAAQV